MPRRLFLNAPTGSCIAGHTPYINFQRLRRFRSENTGSCITGHRVISIVLAIDLFSLGRQ